MNPKTWLPILDEIASTSSKNDKLLIMEQHADDPVFKLICYMAYEPSLNYYISAPDDYNTLEEGTEVPYDLEAALNDLLYFSKGHIRGNEQRDHLRRILNLSTADNAEIVCRILSRDLKCGINVSSVNKTWPGLISTFDFLLADTDSTAINYPAISEVKEDGMRCKLHVSNVTGRVTAISRQGKPIEVFDYFDKEALSLVGNSSADLDGELICYRDGKRLTRKESNGIINKAIKGTITREEADLIRFIVWDIDEPSGEHGYLHRFMALERQVQAQSPERIILIEARIVETPADALKHFKEVRRRGLEGTIVKNLDGKWVPKRSKNLCKFKAEIEAEFKVTGFELGTGKNKNRVGALFVESEDGLVKSKVGIFKDFDESIRDVWMNNLPEIVTVLYNERITDKSRKDGTESLFLPRVTAVRLDKDHANTRAEMIEIERAILED